MVVEAPGFLPFRFGVRLAAAIPHNARATPLCASLIMVLAAIWGDIDPVLLKLLRGR